MNRMNAERHRQVIQLRQINPQRTVFNFGNGAARGILPAGILQPVGQINPASSRARYAVCRLVAR